MAHPVQVINHLAGKGNRPRGYLPAKDDPETNRDAMDENSRDPEVRDFSDALKQKDKR